MAEANGKNETIENKNPKPASSNKKGLIVTIIVVLVVVLLTGFGTYSWRSASAKTQADSLNNQIAQLKADKKDLEAKLKKANGDVAAATKPATVTPAPCSNLLTATQLENVHASVESKNTAALDGLMTSDAAYAVAASGAVGMGKAAAIQTLTNVLTNTTGTWNWSIPAATLNAYKAGDYKSYINDDTIYGVSSDKVFVSFRVTCGKIDQVFMSASTDLL